MKLSIVIPCLNEEETIAIVIKKALKSIERLEILGEVIVADNGSSDNSKKIAESLGARVVEVKNKGYGNALIGGMNSAKGKYIIMGDADDSYNFEEIDPFLREIEKGYDIVIGTRLKGRIEKGAMPFLHRYLGTPVLTFILNLLFKTKITDCNCGMRCLTKEAYQKMQMHSSGMEFASEMLIKAGLIKLKIKEIPITLYKDKRSKAPHLNTWRDGWRHLKFLFLYSPTYLFLIPGSIMMIIGLIIMLALIGGPLQIGETIFDYHSTILGSLFFILGYQTVNTGLQAKAYIQTQKFRIEDKFFKKIKKIFTLERGILLGVILFLAGFTIDFSILIKWINSNYQNLNEASLVTFASTLMITGLQTIFSSFFLSFVEVRSTKN